LLNLKIPLDIKKRVDKLYDVLRIAQSVESDTTELEKSILKLEKRYIEHALRIKLTDQELRELQSIVNVKTIFPGSKVVGVSTKLDSLNVKVKTKTTNSNELEELHDESLLKSIAIEKGKTLE